MSAVLFMRMEVVLMGKHVIHLMLKAQSETLMVGSFFPYYYVEPVVYVWPLGFKFFS